MNGQLDVVQIVREKITKKAYEVYELKGNIPGHELEDWLEGERLVFTELLFPAPAKKQKAPAKKKTMAQTNAKTPSDTRSKKRGASIPKADKPTFFSPFW
ncbi:MAG TPA: DUF2934 domain-containing protein [Nitrospiria bacterium]|jgi:hypothetical protein